MVDVAHDGDDRGARLLSSASTCRRPAGASSTSSSFDSLATWPISSTTSVAVSRIDGLVDGGHHAHVSSWVLMTSVALTAIFCAISCARDGLADGHFALDGRGGHFEGVFRLDAT